MKVLMRSYVNWLDMDKEIENLVKTCQNCAFAAKAPPVKFSSWPKTDKPWSMLHIDYAGPIKGTYYFIVVDSFRKLPEVFKCKTSTSSVTIDFLHELFARFGLLETIVSDNATQFSLKNFYKIHLIVHLTSPPYHPRSNGMTERLFDVFKRAIKANGNETVNEELQKFLSTFYITPNVNASSGMALVELLFSRKIRSVFDRLIPTEKKIQQR